MPPERRGASRKAASSRSQPSAAAHEPAAGTHSTLGHLRKRAWDLREQGHAYPLIAKRLNVSAIRARDLCRQYEKHRDRKSANPYSLELSTRAISAIVLGKHGARFGKNVRSRLPHLPEIACAYSRRELLAGKYVGEKTCDEIEAWLKSRSLALRPTFVRRRMTR